MAKAKAKKDPELAPEEPAAEPYRVLALKYRPQTFADVIGQRHVVRQLQTEIRDNRVGHAYLFTGPRGVGKTSLARIFAKALNCVEGPTPDPCGKCTHCLGIAGDADLDVVEVDAATYTKKEETVELLEGIDRVTFNSRSKVYIIDEVHMFSTHSFNVLLKRLEEPPPGVVFILATTNPEKIPETVISRCRRLEFDRMDTADIVGRLEEIAEREKVTFIGDDRRRILEAIALASEGGMRDAQVSLDQLISLSEGALSLESARQLLGIVEGELLLKLLEGLVERDTAKCLLLVNDMVEKGRDLQRFIKTFTTFLRDGMLLKANAPVELLKTTRSDAESLRALVSGMSMPFVLNLMQQFLDLEEKMRGAAPARFLLEFTIMKLTAIHPRFVLDGLDAGAVQRAVDSSGAAAVAASAAPAPSGAQRSMERAAGGHAMPHSAAAAPMLHASAAVAMTVDSLPEIGVGDVASPATVVSEESFEVQRARFIELCGRRQPGLSAIISHASTAIEGESLRVVLSPTDRCMLGTLERPENYDDLRRAAVAAFGPGLRVVLSVAQEADAEGYTSEPDEEPAEVIEVQALPPARQVAVARREERSEQSAPVPGAMADARGPSTFEEALDRFPDFREAVDLVRRHLNATPFLFNGRRI